MNIFSWNGLPWSISGRLDLCLCIFVLLNPYNYVYAYVDELRKEHDYKFVGVDLQNWTWRGTKDPYCFASLFQSETWHYIKILLWLNYLASCTIQKKGNNVTETIENFECWHASNSTRECACYIDYECPGEILAKGAEVGEICRYSQYLVSELRKKIDQCVMYDICFAKI